MRYRFCLLWLFFGCVGIHAARYPCEPSTEVARALAALPDPRDLSLTFLQRLQPVRELARKYPNDIFVQRRYQDAFARRLHLVSHQDEMFVMYEAGRGRPLGDFSMPACCPR